MKKVLLISRFIRRQNGQNIFHFKGYFKGFRIHKIIVRGGNFDLGEDYILALEDVAVIDGILRGNLKKSKKIFN